MRVLATLVLPDWIASRLAELASLDIETGAVLLARPVVEQGTLRRLLATRLLEVPESDYVHRRSDSLLIRSGGYVSALALAEQAGAIPIWLHTHPGEGASPRPSEHDRRVDAQLAETFRIRSGQSFYGAVVIARKSGALRFCGHLEAEREVIQIDRMLSVGDRIRLTWNDTSTLPPLTSLFDRHIRAFGADVQRALGDLRIAVVGCGGTGSSVAEQLVRLGVRHLLLIDPDQVAETNLTRVYGSARRDIGRLKVETLREHLAGIAPDAVIDTVPSMITVQSTAMQLSAMDVVFGCTDDNAGRLVLSRLASYMLTLVIDCGVVLTSNVLGLLDGIHGRVTVLHPGAACLVCRRRVDLARASSEMLTPTERIRRQDEGYAVGLPGVEPAVVAYTTMVAAASVAELLERLIGYGPDLVPSELILRLHEREISTNTRAPGPGHYCDPVAGKIGLGTTSPFLEQTWTA